MIDTIDRQTLLELGMGIRSSYERDLSVAACFCARAAETPRATAIVSADGIMRYDELDRQSNALGRLLESYGVRPGDAVGVDMDRSPKLPLALLGILKAGAAYVPVDASSTPERRAQTLADAGATTVLVAGAKTTTRSGLRTVDLIADAALIAGQSDAAFCLDTGAQALASIMYTSGSTGRPKGVEITHRAIVRLVRGTDFIIIAKDDVFLQFAPAAFDASTFEIWGPLLNGATLAVPSAGAMPIEDLGNAIQRFGVTTLWLTAPLFRMVVQTDVGSLARLRNMVTGGDIVSPDHAARFLAAVPSCRLINGYGPTENTTFSCCYTVPSDRVIERPLPIGRPIANSCAYVLDDEMRVLPADIVGELYVGGDGLARGYHGLPALTAERFVPNPFASDGSRLYRTGDRACMRPDGVIEFFGRLDNQVKVRGFRIELDEIEMALGSHSGVLHAAVVAEERLGEKGLHAFVVRSDGARASESELRAHLARLLPSYMMPHRISFRNALPQFASGKIDRAALLHGCEPATPPAVRKPAGRRPASSDSTLATIADIWRRTLDVDRVSPDQNFFDAGGDSLLLLSLHAQLRRAFAIDIVVTDLFRESTIRKQAALVERTRT